MTAFGMPLELYMSSPVHSVRRGTRLERCDAMLRKYGISSLAVLDDDERLAGVVSRTDLLRVGRYRAGGRAEAPPLELPDDTVAGAMTEGAIALPPEASIEEACRQMVAAAVHRVYVTDRGALIGVLSTHDVMFAIRDERITTPISRFMSAPIITIDADDSIAHATDQLGRAHVTGLVVVEHDWPVGVFTQIEAMQARDLPRDTLVDDVMDPAMICLRDDTPLHRAAAQATAVRARRIIACRDRHMSGVLSGLDFARAAISSPTEPG